VGSDPDLGPARHFSLTVALEASEAEDPDPVRAYPAARCSYHRSSPNCPRTTVTGRRGNCVEQPLELLDVISGDAEVDKAQVQLLIGLEGGSATWSPSNGSW
jgi:hypothetical protein